MVNSMIKKIKKFGRHNFVHIPTHMLRCLELNDCDEVEIKVENGSIIIGKCDKKRKSIEELFIEFDGEISEIEIEWGEVKGLEIW